MAITTLCLTGCNFAKDITPKVGMGQATETEAKVEESKEEASVEQTTSDVEKYASEETYAPEVNEDLLEAIEQISISYDEFSADKETKKDTWQEYFIDHFIRSDWDGYAYRQQKIEKDNHCIATKEQIEYVQYSLTGIDISFDSMKEDSIDVSSTVNATNNTYCEIKDYEVGGEDILGEGKINITANIEIGRGNTDEVKTYGIYVVLAENPKSCFGGYSIVSLFRNGVFEFNEAATEINGNVEDGSEHSFYGWCNRISDESTYSHFEFDEADDDIVYAAGVSVDITSKQRKFIEANPYEEFKVTYVYTKDMDNHAVESVKATNIEIADDNFKNRKSAEGDPLKGLVADDILEKFRASRPVKKPDSVEYEARALGHWVQETIGKDGFSEELREKGTDIGNGYEFCFGTDVGNNFDNNVPRMYEVYFTLKDYYNSDGKNNKEYYDDLIEDNEDLGNGDPKKIDQMYSDLQEFISMCNNVIRER
ncbi:hypothetical protein D6853_06995 [Butyrivibrio sp. X503]|nr:hypothetical protein D6853_06995 [Butyrivibrio sp. X503]